MSRFPFEACEVSSASHKQVNVSLLSVGVSVRDSVAEGGTHRVLLTAVVVVVPVCGS
jgi:hypothetical protein